MSQLYPYPPYEYSTTCSHLPIVFSFVLVSDSAGDNVLEEHVAKESGIDIWSDRDLGITLQWTQRILISVQSERGWNSLKLKGLWFIIFQMIRSRRFVVTSNRSLEIFPLFFCFFFPFHMSLKWATSPPEFVERYLKDQQTGILKVQHS